MNWLVIYTSHFITTYKNIIYYVDGCFYNYQNHIVHAFYHALTISVHPMFVRSVLRLQKLYEPNHAFKVSDGFPQLQKMEKGDKLHVFFFSFRLYCAFNLKLNAIMSGYGINIFIPNMLAI